MIGIGLIATPTANPRTVLMPSLMISVSVTRLVVGSVGVEGLLTGVEHRPDDCSHLVVGDLLQIQGFQPPGLQDVESPHHRREARRQHSRVDR